jgi:hypothetical protein
MIVAMIVYGPRDAASVLMNRGHRVARVYRSRDGLREWAWKVDGQLVTLADLEDAAERYEKLRNRMTRRGPRPAPARPLRCPLWLLTFTGSCIGAGRQPRVYEPGASA